MACPAENRSRTRHDICDKNLLTILGNSSNRSRAGAQYRMQVSNMFTVNFMENSRQIRGDL